MFGLFRPETPLDKAGKLKLLCSVLVCGLALAWLYMLAIGWLYGGAAQYAGLFFSLEHQFSDFFANYYGWNFSQAYQLNHCCISVTSGEDLLLYISSMITQQWISFLVYSFIGSAAYIAYCVYETRQCSLRLRVAAVTVLTACCYPFLFALDRGNMQLFYFVFMAAFLVSYSRGAYMAAAVWFGLSLGIKPFQIVFAVLFMADKRYRELLLAFGVFAIFVTASAAVLSFANGLSILQFINPPVGPDGGWASGYHHKYVLGNVGLYHGHSVFGMLKVFALYYFGSGAEDPALAARFVKPYFAAACAAFAYIGWFVIKKETVLWRRVALLTVCMTALPFVSADYRLMLFVIPAMMFFNAAPAKNDAKYAMLFALVLVPKNYYFAVPFLPPDVGQGMVLTPLVMLYFAGALMQERGLAVWK